MATKGLRERQKETRRARIVEIARRKFQDSGYAVTTIEDIAAEAELSAVTIYKYFGSKAGILLALVRQSDLFLIQKLDECVNTPHQGLTEGVLAFGRIMRQHAMTYLQKPTWREVISASISEGSKEFGRTYNDLDNALIEKMEALIFNLQEQGKVTRNLDSRALADCLFSLQNIRFFQFIADDTIGMDAADKNFQQDLASLQAAYSG
ncbi:TetR/AcrR family transcriptional regulator [Leisingera thetidis]|uniref:TetR/AcrR family transcriptional regulator n=1 Tax=Leisingera thetidis TaxID=2930199 RepID=UPI0021F7A15A|nr:TetR/AcrR family transcriptional regulator [Leisingera thetidis]